jgi:FixJ family two-component response regulator
MAGYQVEVFASGEQFLRCRRTDIPACLLLEVELPGRNGQEVQEELAAAGSRLPIVFLTGHGDIRMAVRAIKSGAVNSLTKPANPLQLLSAIEEAIELDRAELAWQRFRRTVERRAGTLTLRERQVLSLIITGMLNKQIAALLGITVQTVKVHRSHVMLKLQVHSLPELVRLADSLGITA